MALMPAYQDTVLTTSAQVVVPSATLTNVTILKASVANIDTANAHVVTVYRVPVGASIANSYIIVPPLVIPANSEYSLDISGQNVNSGSTIQALAESNSVLNFNASFAIQS
jgi:hypothetical protein